MTGWGGALRHAALAFGIAPEAFWRLSLVEWRALVGEPDAIMRRHELEALMQAYPDAAGEAAPTG